MQKKTYLYLSAVLLILSVTTIYVDSQLESGYHASWIYNYKDVNELKESADLIVLGTVSDSVQEKSDEIDNDLIFTRSTIEITKVISGKADLKEVSVRQMGGHNGKEVVELEDDPLMKKGDEVILFLKEYETNKFKIIGGPQGRFIVDNGKVFSVGEYQDNDFAITSGQETSGKQLSAFIESLTK